MEGVLILASSGCRCYSATGAILPAVPTSTKISARMKCSVDTFHSSMDLCGVARTHVGVGLGGPAGAPYDALQPRIVALNS